VQNVVDEHAAVGMTMNDFLQTWPYLVIPGFGFDLARSDLYCFRESTLNDNAINAFMVFLKTYKNNTTVMMPPPKKQPLKKSTKKEPLVTEKQLLQIRAGISAGRFVLMPINLSGVHWVSMVLDGSSKIVHLYDSMGVSKNLKRLKGIASEIVSAMPDNYSEVIVEGPQQRDSDSCGVLACLHLWKTVSSDAPTDVSPDGITKLRWKMLHASLKVKRRW
jgi:Ulp1 family protease